MLETIGVSSFDKLLAPIPAHVRLGRLLDLPAPQSEYQIARQFEALAALNDVPGRFTSFLGAGAYDHFVPAAVDHLSFRSEFYTAYTPYQAEVGQGTLTTIFEFQSMLAELTGMDLANASLYDGASALAEAALLAASVSGKSRIVVAGPLHPNYLQVLETYCRGQRIEVVSDPCPDGVINRGWVRDALPGAAAVVAQSPNFFGIVEDVSGVFADAKAQEAKAIQVFLPHALPLYKTPADMGADLAVAEGLSLGSPPSFGGPALGLFTTKLEYARHIPGRLVGETVDRNGKRAFVMTLRTREQDIRRAKATSNICTNQALLALRATIYMSLLGPQGLREVALQCLEKSHYLADRLKSLKGFAVPYKGTFFQEFVVQTPRPAWEMIVHARMKNVLPGVDLARFPGLQAGNNRLLVCVTEKHSKADLDQFVEVMEEAVRA
jgi:glycine cleavage system P protein (glycine dehydrogenase) subunit 1